MNTTLRGILLSTEEHNEPDAELSQAFPVEISDEVSVFISMELDKCKAEGEALDMAIESLATTIAAVENGLAEKQPLNSNELTYVMESLRLDLQKLDLDLPGVINFEAAEDGGSEERQKTLVAHLKEFLQKLLATLQEFGKNVLKRVDDFWEHRTKSIESTHKKLVELKTEWDKAVPGGVKKLNVRYESEFGWLLGDLDPSKVASALADLSKTCFHPQSGYYAGLARKLTSTNGKPDRAPPKLTPFSEYLPGNPKFIAGENATEAAVDVFDFTVSKFRPGNFDINLKAREYYLGIISKLAGALNELSGYHVVRKELSSAIEENLKTFRTSIDNFTPAASTPEKKEKMKEYVTNFERNTRKLATNSANTGNYCFKHIDILLNYLKVSLHYYTAKTVE